MKKFSLMLTLAIMMVGSAVFAGSVDYLSNQSAKYIMNTARTAATDGADIVSYNPAGTALMGEGLFLDVSNQTLLKYYTTKEDAVLDDKYEQEEPTWFLPNFYAVYNMGKVGAGKMAVYGQTGVVAGGGKLKYEDGTIGSNDLARTTGLGVQANAAANSTFVSEKSDVEAYSVYYAIGAGVSYASADDAVSASLGCKYVMADRYGKMNATINMRHVTTLEYSLDVVNEYTYEAKGFTPVIGFDIKPMKELTLGFKYEFETTLQFKYDQDKNKVTASGPAGLAALYPVLETGLQAQLDASDKDGDKLDNNLPAIFAMGIEYAVMPELTVSAGATWYFMSQSTNDSIGAMDTAFDTGYELSLGATYKVMEPLKVGATFCYTNQAVKDAYMEDSTTSNFLTTSASPVLDSLMFGLGATFTVMPGLDVTLAGNWVHYLPKSWDVDSASGSTLECSYEKEVYTIALGVGYKI